MKSQRKFNKKNSESGVALLIAIFTLMLIAAIAGALIVSSGTETSLATNYRSTTTGYYAAVAGIEEARGRLLPSNPNSITASLPLTGTPAYLPTNKPVYILNPGIGETAANIMGTYPDNEYATEFPGVTATNTYINSVWVAGGNKGPLYKWVRITPATKKSLKVDVDGTGVLNVLNNTIPLYFDGAPVPAKMVVPTVSGTNPTPTSTQNQVYELTALAVLPNGSQKVVQYVVAAASYNMSFPSALTLAGTVGNFMGANSNPYHVNGADGSGSAPAISGCTANQPAVPAIGVGAGMSGGNSMLTNQQYVINNLPRPSNYTGAGGTPSVSTVTTTGSLQSTASLDQVIQTIQHNADAVIPNPPNPPGYNNSGTIYNFGQTGWPTDMSATNPKVVYVDGSFDLGPNTGYGVLVVTGNFHYHGNSGWNGIILVVGDGTTTFDGQGGGSGQFDGAIFVATTRDSSGNQLANYGTTNFDISGGGGNGIYYNSCWINKVLQPPSYQILSFREISQ